MDIHDRIAFWWLGVASLALAALIAFAVIQDAKDGFDFDLWFVSILAVAIAACGSWVIVAVWRRKGSEGR